MDFIKSIYRADFSKRVILFAYFVAILSIASILYSLNTAKNFYFHNKYTNDPLYIAQERLTPLKPYIEDQRIIGYISDSNDIFNFYTAQHVLVPVILVRTEAPIYIIGNFYKKGNGSINKNHLEIIHNFGNGVFLLKHTVKQ